MDNINDIHPMNSFVTLQDITSAVSGLEVSLTPAKTSLYKAAVAIVLRPKSVDSTTDVEVLFIKRSERKGDPWSGHMAFPGGRVDAADLDLEYTAVRETKEEIGLDLHAQGRLIGPIQPAQPQRNGVGMLVAPYVFALPINRDFHPSYPNDEVDEVIWASFNDMLIGKFHTTHNGFNGFNLDGRVVWGMTYRMMSTLFELLYPDWQPTA